MKKTVTNTILSVAALLCLHNSSSAQITKIADYKNNYSATIGTFDGITFREAGFSALYVIPGTDGKEFWTCSDRGVNVDCGSANTSSCRPTYDKLFCFPSYAPKIHRVRIQGDSVQILKTLSIRRPDKTPTVGYLLPTGFGSTATEQASTDTVQDCTNFASKIAPKDAWSIDCEAISVDKKGNFWLAEENGPSVWKLDTNAVVQKRYSPYANLSGAQPQDVLIDTCFKYRKNNRGFENMTISPSGKVYAIIQSPLLYPTKAVGEASRVHRIIEIDPVTNATRMFAYLNDGVIGASGANQIRLQDWKLGDMTAINDSTFLVLEAAARGTTDIKRMYRINIASATVISSGLYGGLTAEALVDSAGLAGAGIKAVEKTLVMDLLANGWDASLDKAEGITIINDSTIALCNDNDFGQTCPSANGVPVATTNLSHIVVYGLKGANKIPNFIAPSVPVSVRDIEQRKLSVNLYPNPAADKAVLSISAATAGTITVIVTDIQGREMIAPVKGAMQAGTQQLELNIASLQNGLYFVRYQSESVSGTIRMVVMH
ncbi:esterase-like activity of phytase family protein [Rurimicrobium arvi]|uniref:Por secretion system C-terminal sorting domain-containing protein n=1 Tax=Rurimicrobium arvi TaxID=2049916 RepID=A0ABP8MM19_9BACT